MEYKGYIIDISVFRSATGLFGYHASYTIHKGDGGSAFTGTVAGGIRTLEQAEDRAERTACQWVDTQIT